MTNGAAVFILCSTRSGSTWLTLMLGSNPESRYLGELNRMFRRDPEGCALCTERGQWCPLFHDLDRLRPRDVHEALLARTGKRVLIDNSKSLSWARKTLDGPFEKKYIHLMRDPRAVVFSWHRRGRTKGLEKWMDENYAIRDFLSRRELAYRLVTYNDIADRTDDVMTGLCDWLGLVYTPEQKSYWQVEHHGAGRNGATASFLRDYVASDEVFYAERRRTSFHDLRWQTELDEAVRDSMTNDTRLARFLHELGFTLAADGLHRAKAERD